ncbi:MAG: PIG-L deacetylase family protein [Candidatus Glassbacteria bacterium]
MNILAISSHPDDLEYGCGGTLIKYAAKGHNIFLYIATCGELGGDPVVRRGEQEDAGRIIGAKKIFWGEYNDTRIPINPGLIKDIESVMQETNPDFIFTHFWDDTHQDHRALSRSTLSATRYVKNFLFYETPTTQNFTPNVFVDICEVLDRKKQLLEAHSSQIVKTNIEDLNIVECAVSAAMFRGVQGRVKYAEAFASLRLFINI